MLEGGYGLYLRDGKPVFVYNFLSVERITFAAKEALPKERSRRSLSISRMTAGEWARAERSRCHRNGKSLAEGRLGRTIPIQFSLGEGLDVGMDVGSPVDFTYQLPFAFTGKIEKVTIDLK